MKIALALLLASVLTLAGNGAAQAQAVALTGVLGNNALLVVDGRTPKSVAVGDIYLGVKVISILSNTVVVEVYGTRKTLRMGDSPVSIKSQSGPNSPIASAENHKIVLQAGSHGHFLSAGQINGRAVHFLVDTGASVVALSVADADRIGLNYKTGQPVQMSTANGMTQGWRVKLASVRVGAVDVYEVDAVVSPGNMPYVLLGNSFLMRFQMARTNDQMVLEKRY